MGNPVAMPSGYEDIDIFLQTLAQVIGIIDHEDIIDFSRSFREEDIDRVRNIMAESGFYDEESSDINEEDLKEISYRIKRIIEGE